MVGKSKSPKDNNKPVVPVVTATTPTKPKEDDTMIDDSMQSIIEFSVDISDAERPAPLPKGTYRASIREAKVAESQQRGTKYAAVSFFISADQYPMDYTDGNPDGTLLVYRRTSLEDNPGARYSVRRMCEAIGAPMSTRIDLSEWVGRDATVEVDHETYEGEARAVIKRVLAD